MEKFNKSLGEWSINVDQESGDSEMNQEVRKEDEKGKGLERPVIWGATSEVPYKVNPLHFTTCTLSMCFGLGKKCAVSCPLFH